MNRRSIALGLAVAAYLLSFFHRVAPAAIAQDLVTAFQIGAAALGSLAATYFYIYTLMQVPAGILADTLGPRKLLFLGGLVAGAGSLLFGLAPRFEVAFAGRALVGLGVSVTFIAMLKLIAVWFDESRFATVNGLCMLIGNLGSILAGAPLVWLIQFASWRQIFAAAGVLSVLIGIASLFLVRDGPQLQPQRHPGAARHDRTAWLSGLLTVLKNRATWPGFFVNLGIGGSLFGFAGLWAVPYFTQVTGMTRAVASNHISLYFLGFAVGAAVWGRISDHLGRRKPIMFLGTLLHALGWLVWLSEVVLPLAASYPFCLLMGIMTASVTLSWACAKEVNPPLLSGMATSVVNVGVFLGAAILQPLVGWVMDRNWLATNGVMENGARLYSAGDYRVGLLLMTGAALLGCLSTLLIRETGCRNIWKETL